MPLAPLLAAYDHVLLDLDGCVWISGTLVPGTAEALEALRGAGRAVSFVTNDVARSPEEYVRTLWGLGLKASLEEIVSVGCALQFLLAQRARPATVFVIGAPAIHRHVADAGQRIVNGGPLAGEAELVVAAAHERLHYDELRGATRALCAGAELIVLGRDRTYPTAGGPSPSSGAVAAALEYATGVHGRCVGKPDPLIFRTALDRTGAGTERALMVGDNLDSDLGGAAAAGIDAAIVLSGITTRAQAQSAREPAPIAIAETLHALVLGGG